jgi:YD repeat-containing protein
MKIYIASALLLLSAASCKKDKNDTPEPVVKCDILIERKDSTANGSVSTHIFEYDAQDRIIKELINGATYLTMEYTDNGKTIREVHANNIRTYTLNDEGRTTRMRTEENNGSINDNTYIIVGGYTQQIITRSYASEGAIPSIDTTFFENTVSSGNLVKIIMSDPPDAPLTINMTYNLSKLSSASIIPKAYESYVYFFSGPSTNLVNSFQLFTDNANQSGTATYEFDSKGRVKRQITTTTIDGQALPIEIADYKYRCD